MNASKIISVCAVILLIGAGVWWFVESGGAQSAPPPTSTACTMDAKLCPDGSYVGRAGPKCEFTPCPPSATSTKDGGTGRTSFVYGTVTLSPVCPVERIPPDPRCAPKPYQTTVRIFLSDGTELVKTVHSGSDGRFAFTLPFGAYSVQAGGETLLPRCPPLALSLMTVHPAQVAISCDTGIR